MVARTKYPSYLTILGVLVSAGLAIAPRVPTGLMKAAWAREAAREETIEDISEIRFESPPDDGDPGPSPGGATRSPGCFLDSGLPKLPMTALLPETRKGLTVAARPTFFAYIPGTVAAMGDFVIAEKQEDGEVEIYKTTFPLSQSSGIVRFTIPDLAPPLEIGKKYEWSLGIICDTAHPVNLWFVAGAIERINAIPNGPSSAIDELSLSAIRYYAENGIWHETLANLAELRSSQPNDIIIGNIWSRLLTSVGLDLEIAKKPIVDCCEPSGDKENGGTEGKVKSQKSKVKSEETLPPFADRASSLFAFDF
ncbi:MAG: DUF928 domain-containing protein [Oscillatoria sp. SIO1A7]|nr:DUF928 domain-containing protein [Oscillatoria sp. SIO1A7]